MAENYVVSARKYRPQTFDTVVGQEHITTTLKNAIRHNHLAHAYLFCGPRGVGKTTCARILARTINCETPTADMEACGVCNTCISFNNNTSFNIFELDAASNNSVDDIRTLIDQVRFAPQAGKYKIYIIDEVHMLSAAAFNAFLKTLEEPPPYAIFILATTEKHKILPTILSRCQIFDFKRITTHDIVTHLQGIAAKESMIAQEAALHVIAQKSEGCMRDALSMLDRIASFTNGMLTYSNTMEHLNLLDADYYFKITDHLLSQDVSGTLLLLDQVLERGFEGDVVLEGLAEHMRNLLLCKDTRMARLLDVPNDHKPMYHEKANQAPPSFIISALNVINDSELEYRNANNKRLHVEMCLIKLCYVLQATTAGSLQLSGESKHGATQLSGNSFQSSENDIKKKPGDVVAAQSGTVAGSGTQNKKIEEPAVSDENTPVENTVHEPEPNNAAVTNSKSSGVPLPGSSARKISKGFLGDLNAPMQADNPGEVKELSESGATEIFEKYKQKVQSENKSMLHAQLCVMKVAVLPPDEIRIISPTDLTDTYAKEQRNLLIDFFRAHSGVMVRVTTEVKEDADIAAQQATTVLSKSEMFEAMARKNPNLLKLKDGLNLQIDY